MLISQESLQYVYIPLKATLPLGVTYDPTSDTVTVAYLPDGTVPTTGFNVASWSKDAQGNDYVKILVGPGGAVTLGAGSYRTFVKINDSPEIPVLEGDILQVF